MHVLVVELHILAELRIGDLPRDRQRLGGNGLALGAGDRGGEGLHRDDLAGLEHEAVAQVARHLHHGGDGVDLVGARGLEGAGGAGAGRHDPVVARKGRHPHPLALEVGGHGEGGARRAWDGRPISGGVEAGGIGIRVLGAHVPLVGDAHVGADRRLAPPPVVSRVGHGLEHRARVHGALRGVGNLHGRERASPLGEHLARGRLGHGEAGDAALRRGAHLEVAALVLRTGRPRLAFGDDFEGALRVVGQKPREVDGIAAVGGVGILGMVGARPHRVAHAALRGALHLTAEIGPVIGQQHMVEGDLARGGHGARRVAAVGGRRVEGSAGAVEHLAVALDAHAHIAAGQLRGQLVGDFQLGRGLSLNGLEGVVGRPLVSALQPLIAPSRLRLHALSGSRFAVVHVRIERLTAAETPFHAVVGLLLVGTGLNRDKAIFVQSGLHRIGSLDGAYARQSLVGTITDTRSVRRSTVGGRDFNKQVLSDEPLGHFRRERNRLSRLPLNGLALLQRRRTLRIPHVPGIYPCIRRIFDLALSRCALIREGIARLSHGDGACGSCRRGSGERANRCEAVIVERGRRKRSGSCLRRSGAGRGRPCRRPLRRLRRARRRRIRRDARAAGRLGRRLGRRLRGRRLLGRGGSRRLGRRSVGGLPGISARIIGRGVPFPAFPVDRRGNVDLGGRHGSLHCGAIAGRSRGEGRSGQQGGRECNGEEEAEKRSQAMPCARARRGSAGIHNVLAFQGLMRWRGIPTSPRLGGLHACSLSAHRPYGSW